MIRPISANMSVKSKRKKKKNTSAIGFDPRTYNTMKHLTGCAMRARQQRGQNSRGNFLQSKANKRNTHWHLNVNEHDLSTLPRVT